MSVPGEPPQMEWVGLAPYLIAILSLQLILSLSLLLVVFKYPIVLYKIWKRYLIYSSGFSKKTVKVSDNFEFSYMERGNAKDNEISLLLIHGFSSDKESWCLMGKAIPKRIHVIAPDLPGHGSSTRKEKEDVSIQGLAKRVEQFVNAVGLNQKKYHIAGTSLGGYIVGIHATMFPKNLASALLVCPAGIKSPIESEMLITYEKEKKILLLPKTNKEFIDMIDLLVHKPVKFPEIIVSGVMQARRQAHEFYYRMLEGFMNENERYLLQEHLTEIKTKMLVVWGKYDRALHVSSTDVIRKILPDIDIMILDDCGHSISLERPRKLARIVTRFIEDGTTTA